MSSRIVRFIVVLLLAAPLNLFAAAALEKFADVKLIENPSNDGDSFVVQAGARPLHVRLYFADCPESVATTDADAKRVREQARYFGITDAKKVFDFGREAKTFTKQTLAKPFTIYTSFADALGTFAGRTDLCVRHHCRWPGSRAVAGGERLRSRLWDASRRAGRHQRR